MQNLVNKVAFVTGGSSGIGLGIARACLNAGMKVAVGYRTGSHMEEALECLQARRDRIYSIHLDVTDRRGMENAAAETAERFGKVHLLVNNAGVSLDVRLSEATYDDWDWLLNVNLTGVFNGVRAFLPFLKAHGEGGHIATTSSVLGLIANGRLGAYATTKFGVTGMMEALRADLAEANIGVSVICPGVVKSNIWDADRNRPGKTLALDVGQREQFIAAAKKASEHGMDPWDIGELVLQGIRDNHLYILTHREFEQGIRERCEALLASITGGRSPSAELLALEQEILRSPIYALERDKRLQS